ncbi:MAG: hypothetical protein CVU69_05695 [Deltaproteobacteria bacterium HGW-Deltaproteobacteria-4]|nr:MAG: hypothetical protein CVU69_05695 [Deltaproteobacteria bacterium HGW-Deltaproteobacteria-4]
MSSVQTAFSLYAGGLLTGDVARPSEIDEQDWPLVLRLASKLFLEPTRTSRDLAKEFALSRPELVRLYRVIRNIREIQDAWTFDSPLRRRVSFLRRELQPENLPSLQSMFNGEVCLPNHIEFHPALMCNLRCRACPNIQSDSKGDWQFLGYPKLGVPLQPNQLNLIADLFLEMGINDYSFGGGGEPSLSDLTLEGIAHLHRSSKAEISLYTNGIFPASWGEAEFRTLVSGLHKMRFSIDAANAQEWSSYKGRPTEFFELLWKNIQAVVQAKRKEASSTRIGASCLVSDLTCNDVEVFLLRAMNTGLDFCDIKAVETCFGEKTEYKAKSRKIREVLGELISKVRAGIYAPMDVVVDDSLLRDEGDPTTADAAPSRCWIAVRGRMLTVGPYGELYPCSDAANPGAVERCNNKLIGQLTDFSSLDALRAEFTAIWSDSLSRRQLMSRNNCSYCVPSHNNYNTAVDKLYQDWQFGIMPEDQPFAGEPDHYHRSHGS